MELQKKNAEMRLLPRLKANSYKLKNPPEACLGRARVSIRWVYRFSLLTLLFSGVVKKIKHRYRQKLRLIL